MIYYAIGRPGKPIRTIVRYIDDKHLRLNTNVGEVFVKAPSPHARGSISTDGKWFVEASLDMEHELARIRQRRTELLARCDYTILPDSPFTPAQREAWTDYRMALRDITKDQPEKTFDEISWPPEPSA